MKKDAIHLLLLTAGALILFGHSTASGQTLSTGPASRTANLTTASKPSQPVVSPKATGPQAYRGWPRHTDYKDLRSAFMEPPTGFGNVPFFWFNGDTLTRERMTWILDELAESATDGFAVSYMHLCPDIDSLEHRGEYGLFGHTEPGKPEVFSEAWWEFWNWFSTACAERGMGAGLDDYTVGWPGNGYYPDEVYKLPKYRDYQGKLIITAYEVPAGTTPHIPIPPRTVSVAAYENQPSVEPIDLTGKTGSGALAWETQDKDYTVYITHTEADYLLHPDNGKDLVNVYFNRFEERMTAEGKAGMNYFFQDELVYPLNILSWSEDMRDEFQSRKGYDIIPYLPMLQHELGDLTPKIRLDYCDVLMTLAEERYFEPIFAWHNERGLIYGCDNLGRGREPLSYLDYFRATSWFTAPGNDAPARGSSFMQTKVSSSISHAYDRPRTWLEAFHSMGWGSKAEWLTEQIDHHMIAGGNLVCMHGLYYSTHGGWWEWAPPCFHFRMPYWPHMKKWLEYTERLSFLLSQGHHVCDIAILYPTETLQAYDPQTTERYDFGYAMQLSNSGLDYDFLDNRSLIDAQIDNRQLVVGEERYSVLMLKDIKALKYDALMKIYDFYRAGGIVVAVGELPLATDRAGANDPELNKILEDIFGVDATHLGSIEFKAQTNPEGGTGFYTATMRGVIPFIKRTITPDFNPGRSGGKVLHRRLPKKDIYMVMNVKPGTECFFRAKGKVELWDATDGSVTPLPITKVSAEGTHIRLDAPENRSYLIVFSPGEPQIATSRIVSQTNDSVIPLNGLWQVEAIPTLDNRWGDFRLPKSDEMIGIEARSFRYAPLSGLSLSWMDTTYNPGGWATGTYGYGNYMEVLVDSSDLALSQLIQAATGTNRRDWKNYPFSWQYGVEGEPGSQGYHGLKGKVDNDFLVLGERGRMLFRTQFYAPESGSYVIRTGHIPPDKILIDGTEIQDRIITTKKGWHQALVVFDLTQNVPLDMPKHFSFDPRPRSAFVIQPVSDSTIHTLTPYSDLLGMDWYLSNRLAFHPQGANSRGAAIAYRFETAPGLEKMQLDIHGRLERVWVNGELITRRTGIRSLGNGKFEITLPKKEWVTSTVAMQIVPHLGYRGAAVFKEPVKLICASGYMETGDWSKNGALLYYSGGMRYTKNVVLNQEELKGKVVLDLGEVSATCEIRVNGHEAGVHIYSPFRTDITPYLKTGENEIEVLVYSTLANHYQTIPSSYKGEPEAGLMGPVNLEISKE